MKYLKSRSDFTVTKIKEDVVKAVLPLQEHWLPQSNLDLLLPPIDFAVFFCYDNDDAFVPFGSAVVARLKNSLAQCLITYYPFAGEVVQNSLGEPEVWCNNRGVGFVEAYADVELAEIDLYNPDESVKRKLVMEKKHGVIAVQVTELKCGGVVVSCTFDHRVSDAYSANLFLVAWSDLARNEKISVRPTFRRSLVNPRRPAHRDPLVDSLYVPISKLAPPEVGASEDPLISHIYYITADKLEELQSAASTKDVKRTKLQTLSAVLWQMTAMNSYQSDNKTSLIAKLGIVVDGRTRLEVDEAKTTTMETYIGNVLSIPYGEESVQEMKDKPLSWVAGRVGEFLKPAVTKDHFLDLIDMIETRRPEPSLAKIYCFGEKEGPRLVVSSGLRFPVGKVDFGWGRPRVGSYYFPVRGDCAYVMPMPDAAGNGDWLVYMLLTKGQFEFIEADAAHIFKPFTFDRLLSF